MAGSDDEHQQAAPAAVEEEEEDLDALWGGVFCDKSAVAARSLESGDPSLPELVVWVLLSC